MAAGVIHVVRPGLLTSVQDLGRWGHQAAGVPVAGPMDLFSHRLANLLVGNDDAAATIEITLIGPELEFSVPSMIAVTGAEFEMTLDDRPLLAGVATAVAAGSRVTFRRRRAGARAYLAVHAGVQTPPLLGSRATHLLSGMGGLHGRPLAAGDRVPILPTPTSARALTRRVMGLALPANGRARLRVLPGAQVEWFDASALTTLTATGFRVSPRSDRMGYRLQGPPLVRRSEGEPISEPVAFGALQVPPAGEPILLMADRQTAGGYPKIASVIAADLPIAGQLSPGDTIEFALCTRQEATAALIARERALLRVSDLTSRAADASR
jgi:antagonist of KipI